MARKLSSNTTTADGTVENYRHEAAKRLNIPTAENQGLVPDNDKAVKTLRYPRNPDLDPQLVWRGKDAEDDAPLEVAAPPIYIQEKIHPRALIENLRRQSAARKAESAPQIDFFHDFNGIDPEARTEFYAHDQNWQNRMILGDQPARHGLARRTRGATRKSAVHLFRSALWHQIQFELAAVDEKPRREGRQGGERLARAGSRARIPRHMERRHPLLP
jgi:hypothetical protein